MHCLSKCSIKCNIYLRQNKERHSPIDPSHPDSEEHMLAQVFLDPFGMNCKLLASRRTDGLSSPQDSAAPEVTGDLCLKLMKQAELTSGFLCQKRKKKKIKGRLTVM